MTAVFIRRTSEWISALQSFGLYRLRIYLLRIASRMQVKIAKTIRRAQAAMHTTSASARLMALPALFFRFGASQVPLDFASAAVSNLNKKT